MKHILILTVLFTTACSTLTSDNRNVAFNSNINELEFIKQKIKTLDYALPEKTINRYLDIKKELNPEVTNKKSEVLKTENSLQCYTEEIKIYYIDNENIMSFTALFQKPRNYYSKIWFKGKRKFPTIVVQPTLAGPTLLENRIRTDLCKNGFASIVPTETLLELPEELPDFKNYDKNMRIEMIRAQRMVDHLLKRNDVESTQIGTIGFSRGAIASSLLIGLDQRIKYAYLGAGGVGFAEIIARSQTEKGLEDNKKQMDASGLNSEQFENELLKNLEYEALLFAHKANSDRIKVLIIKNDLSVSTEHQELLKKAFNNPKTTYVTGIKEGSHIKGILKTVFINKKDYLEFFKQQIK